MRFYKFTSFLFYTKIYKHYEKKYVDIYIYIYIYVCMYVCACVYVLKKTSAYNSGDNFFSHLLIIFFVCQKIGSI
jgi:hypothetical protein